MLNQRLKVGVEVRDWEESREVGSRFSKFRFDGKIYALCPRKTWFVFTNKKHLGSLSKLQF